MSKILSKISSIESEDKLGEMPAGNDSDIIRRDNNPKYTPAPSENAGTVVSQPGQDSGLRGTRKASFTWINVSILSAIIFWTLSVSIVTYTSLSSAPSAAPLTALQLTALALFILGPIIILLVLGYALRQLAQISADAHGLSRTAQNLMSPDETAYSRSSIMARNIKGEIDNVNTQIDRAVSRMATLKDTLEEQIQSIDRVSYLAENKTELIASQLSEEREALSAIATTYDDRMAALSQNLDTHSANLAKSTKEAEQKINEARISVEGAASKINSASDIVLQNTVEAANKLDANQSEITRLGDELKTRADELDALYGKHATDLGAMISEMRDEQENLAVSLEAGLQKMRDMSLTAQVSAKHLTEASNSGRKTVVALADAARLTDTAVKQRFADMEEMVRFSNARAESISEKAARRVQDSLAQTRKEISRIEYDMVELQERLKTSGEASQAAPSAAAAQPAPTTNTVPKRMDEPKKRKGLLGLKPIDEPDELIPATDEDTPTKQAAPQERTSAAAASPKLSGLRPIADPSEDIIFENSEDAPLEDITDEIAIPNISEIISPDDADEDHSLVLEIPVEDDFVAPAVDKDITEFDPDFLRPSVPTDNDRKAKSTKSKSWWKNLFSGDDDVEVSPLDALTAPSGTATKQTAPHDVSDEAIVTALADIGLAPAAIVDDGCIIEAVNTRISRGPLAMSDVITHRLEDPVRHLYDTAAADKTLHENITQFARRFHTSLGDIEDNREAIRQKFESDAGRAFLLCDAALNR